jgi:hypothetical protein
MIQRTFLERFGHHGVCILPDDVLSDNPLIDPETGEELPSLRGQVSLTEGIIHHCLCYARVLRTCGNGLYWADIAATPDLGNAIRVILSEEALCFALPYDVRVQSKCPSHILKMMAAHARKVRPAQRVATEPPPEPALLLEPFAVVEVRNEALQEAVGPLKKLANRDTNQQRVYRHIGSVCLQQAFLRVIIDALMTQLYWSQWTQNAARLSAIKAQCALVSSLQRWQRRSR